MARRAWLDDVMLVTLTTLAFLSCLASGLVPSWDDGRFLVDFEPVQTISWVHFTVLWSEPHFEAYHPLHLLSYWIDVPLFGVSGPALHITSLALWCGGAMIVRRLFVQLGASRTAALVGTLVFALHPVQVEAVAWATGRKDVLAALFCAAALLAHLRAQTRKARLAVVLLYACAVLSKTSSLPLPLVMLVMDRWLRQTSWAEAIKRQLPLLAGGAALGALVVTIWSGSEMVRQAPDGFARALLVLSTLSHYVWTLLWPLNTSPLYPIHRTTADYAWTDFVGLVPLLAMSFFARRSLRVRFSLVAFVLLLLPVLNFIPVYWERQDRYLSLPLLIAGLGAAWAMDAFGERRVIVARVAFSVLAVALGARTAVYARAFASDARLWTHATQTQPRSYYAWVQLGHHHRDGERFDEARAAYTRARNLEPTMRLAHTLLFALQVRVDAREYALESNDRWARRFDAVANDESALRGLAGDMIAAGYREAALLPLGLALDIAPLDDAVIERAALVQHREGHGWLAAFYVSRMSSAPSAPALAQYPTTPLCEL